MPDRPGWLSFYSKQAVASFNRSIDQCEGQMPFRAIFVDEDERDTAHGIYYNGPPLLKRRDQRLQTYNREMKVSTTVCAYCRACPW